MDTTFICVYVCVCVCVCMRVVLEELRRYTLMMVQKAKTVPVL